jgi:hypothetical protein
MRPSTRSLSLLAAAAALFLATAPAQAAPSHEAQAANAPAKAQTAVPAPADKAAVPATPDGEFQYGPIHAKDPEVRNQIKKLYRDQAALEAATATRLAELSTALQGESDPEFRLQITRDMVREKQGLQLRSVELGLEIARLNGDERRVAEFEKALDQLQHPERYMPPTLDPSVAEERARQMGLVK